ncbi:transposase [Nocardiopsis nanhaiensis]
MKHYPPEFKADAVALYRSRPGVTIAHIADELGINRETLRNWIRADDDQRSTHTSTPAKTTRPGTVPATESLEDENQRLRAQVADLIRDIGIPGTAVRTSALRQLVLQAPAPVIARALGFHDKTTPRVVAEAGGIWNHYAPSDHK